MAVTLGVLFLTLVVGASRHLFARRSGSPGLPPLPIMGNALSPVRAWKTFERVSPIPLHFNPVDRGLNTRLATGATLEMSHGHEVEDPNNPLLQEAKRVVKNLARATNVGGLVVNSNWLLFCSTYADLRLLGIIVSGMASRRAF
ncbi:hypothetical protein C8Q79DRAFT_923185 [Trametes meyenii]|nr:hypothetical protein C8Q79DRAFT_923185 [Trametes meyenii]